MGNTDVEAPTRAKRSVHTIQEGTNVEHMFQYIGGHYDIEVLDIWQHLCVRHYRRDARLSDQANQIR